MSNSRQYMTKLSLPPKQEILAKSYFLFIVYERLGGLTRAWVENMKSLGASSKYANNHVVPFG